MAPNLLKYALNMGDMRVAPIKSKVMFAWNFKAELAKLIDKLEETFEAIQTKHFVVDSAIPGNTNIKIRLTDTELGEQMIVNCVFWYHHDDKRYGRINIDLVTSGYTQKNKVHFVWTFGILDTAGIEQKVCHDLVEIVKF